MPRLAYRAACVSTAVLLTTLAGCGDDSSQSPPASPESSDTGTANDQPGDQASDQPGTAAADGPKIGIPSVFTARAPRGFGDVAIGSTMSRAEGPDDSDFLGTSIQIFNNLAFGDLDRQAKSAMSVVRQSSTLTDLKRLDDIEIDGEPAYVITYRTDPTLGPSRASYQVGALHDSASVSAVFMYDDTRPAGYIEAIADAVLASWQWQEQ